MREIPLTQGKVALVDDEDYEELAQYKWYARVERRTVYACRTGSRVGGRPAKKLRMHNVITGAERTDHKDGNGLDNRRSNLRPATAKQNARNMRPKVGTSAYAGVYWGAAIGKWRAQITIDGKAKHLGCFLDEGEAARAYDRAALERDPEFHYLNFPD